MTTFRPIRPDEDDDAYFARVQGLATSVVLVLVVAVVALVLRAAA